MTTATLTLADFLLARIAEDEETASEDDWFSYAVVEAGYSNLFDEGGSLYLTVTPARVLAECAAKREIVSLHTPLGGEDADPSCGDVETPCGTLRALAAVYSDHPDYRDEWRQ